MHPTSPRVAPLRLDELDGEAREILESFARGDQIPNIFATLAHHPKLLKRWRVFASHVLGKSTLPEREREILILRIGWRARAPYEFSAHVRIGKRAGLTAEDIERIKQGPDAPGLDPFDAALLRAVDELDAHTCMSDATWKTLSERFDTQQMIDVLFTVGEYKMVSMTLNSLGVQPEQLAPEFTT
jgi:4-carboxymuconolactone decarboxylase